MATNGREPIGRVPCRTPPGNFLAILTLCFGLLAFPWFFFLAMETWSVSLWLYSEPLKYQMLETRIILLQSIPAVLAVACGLLGGRRAHETVWRTLAIIGFWLGLFCLIFLCYGMFTVIRDVRQTYHQGHEGAEG